MADLADALRYLQELEDAKRPAFGNPNLTAQGRKMNLPARQAYTAPDPFAEALPMEGRATFLPFRDVEGKREMALPGLLAGALNAFTAPGRALTGSDPTFNPEEEALNVGMNLMGGGGIASKGVPQSAMGMNVWHGSPHRFAPTKENPLGAFDAAKIGSGEGAQAYGYGHYLAENLGTAKSYAPRDLKREDKLMEMYKSAEKKRDYKTMEILESALVHKTASELRDQYGAAGEQVIRRIESVPRSETSIYKVDLADDAIHRMIDLDQPFSLQPKNVRDALYRRVGVLDGPLDGFQMSSNSFLRDNRLGQIEKGNPSPWLMESRSPNGTHRFGLSQKDVDRMFNKRVSNIDDLTGAQIQNRLTERASGSAEASRYLSDLGVPGARYFDQGSRGTAGGEVVGVFRDGDMFRSKIKVRNRAGLGFIDPTDAVTTSMPFSSERAALDWANKKIGQGTSNFVVFPGNEQLIKILSRE